MQTVIRNRMEHGIIRPAGVVSMNDLAHQPEFGLYFIGQPPERLHKPEIQHIGRIQTETIDVKFRHPHPDRVA